MKPNFSLYSLVIFTVTAVAAWCVMDWFLKPEDSSGRAPARLSVERPTVPERPALPRPGSSPGEFLSFISALSQTSAAECQAAFSSTYEVALREAIIQQWAAVDPAGCWQSMQGFREREPGFGPYPTNYIPLLFQQWIRIDYDSAVAALTAPDQRELLSTSAVSMLGVAASMGKETWQKVLGDPRLKDIQIDDGSTSAVRQPPGAGVRMFEAAAACRDAGRPDLALIIGYEAGHSPASGQVDEILHSIKTLPRDVRETASATLVAGLARENLPEARRLVEALPPAEKQMATSQLMSTWAKEQPATAWDWLHTSQPSGKQAAATMWAYSTDPVAGTQVLQAAPPSGTRDAAAAVMAAKWLQRNPAAMASWVQNLEDPEMKRAVYNKIATDWATREPDAAIAAFTAPDAPPLSSGIYQNVTGKLEQISPEKAQAFIQALPPNRAALAQRGLLRK